MVGGIAIKQRGSVINNIGGIIGDKIHTYKADMTIIDIIKKLRDEKFKEILGPANSELEEEIKRLSKVSNKEMFRVTELHKLIKRIGGMASAALGFVSPLLGNAAGVVNDLTTGGTPNTADFKFDVSPEIAKKLEYELFKIKKIVEQLDELVKRAEGMSGSLTPEQLVAYVESEFKEIEKLAQIATEEKRKNDKEQAAEQTNTSKENKDNQKPASEQHINNDELVR